MRIVTRPDFDGIVCAVLIYEAENIRQPIMWVEPSDIQKGNAEIRDGDIIANLPYDERCSLWFDHHVSNNLEKDFQGAFSIAPSAAGVVYKYYKNHGKIKKDFDELIRETDIIDAALLDQDQVQHPEKYPYFLLSMTIVTRDETDPPYWEKLINLLRTKNINEIHDDPEVQKRCEKVIAENAAYKDILLAHTKIDGNISIADFRSMDKAPSGNRFLTYSLFPQAIASLKIRYADNKNQVLLSVGHSIFNKKSNVSIGKLLSKYGGGGHAGAGGVTLDTKEADEKIDEIIKILKQN